MTLNDEYKIGINLGVNTEGLKTLQKFNELMDKLETNFSDLTDRLTSFNDELSSTSAMFKTINSSVMDFSEGISRSVNSAILKFNELNAVMGKAGMGEIAAAGGGRHGFRGHLGRHLGREGFGRSGGLVAAAFAPEVMIPLGAAAFLGKSSWEAASTMQRAQLGIAGLGWGQAFNNAAYSTAMTQSIAGVSPLEYMNAIGQAAAIGRTPQDALKLAPFLARMDFANRVSYSSGTHQWSDADVRNLAQFGEFYSHSHVASKIAAGMNVGEQMYATETGKIPSYYLRDFARRYAGGVSRISPLGLFELLPAIQAFGGSQTGAALSTLQSQLARGQNLKTGKKATAFLRRMGIMDASGHVGDMNLFNKNPSEWIFDFYQKQLTKHGITSDNAIANADSLAFTQRVSRFITFAIENRQKMLASGAEGMKAHGTSAIYAGAVNTNAGQIATVAAAWNKFAIAFSKLADPIIITGLKALTIFLNSLSTLLTGAVWKGAAHEIGALVDRNVVKKINPVWLKTREQNLNTVVNITLDGEPLLSTVVNHANKQLNAPLSTGNSIQTNFAFLNPSLNSINGGGAF